MPDINFTIVKEIAILSESKGGWTKQLNYISWNNNKPKYDLRDWAPNRDKMSRGITLSEEEILNLREALNIYFGDK